LAESDSGALPGLVSRGLSDLAAALGEAGALSGQLVEAAEAIAGSLAKGGVVYLCGNGGSAAEAQHLAAEFVGRFLAERPGLAAVALSTDTSKLTAIGNDYGFDLVFVRQIKALGRPGDVLWGLSTSGTSPNVLKALAAAREAGLRTLLMCGPKPPPEGAAETVIRCPGRQTPRVQEIHLLFGHLVCEMVDEILFMPGKKVPL
jgi:D-sedoheptulose 7-phosphate isomerase